MRLTIDLPIAEMPPESAYCVQHVEAQLQSREQRVMLKRLLTGMQNVGAQMANKRPVARPGDVVRFLLEQIAGAIDDSDQDMGRDE